MKPNLPIYHIIGDMVREPMKMVRSTVSSLIWYTIDISQFRWSIKQDSLTKYFKHLPKGINIDTLDNPALDSDYPKLPEKFVDCCVFRGTTFWLEYQCVDNKTVSDGSMLRLTMSLRTFYNERNKENMRLLIHELLKDTKRIQSNQSKSVYKRICRNGTMFESYDRPHRSWNDTFIPKSQQQQIEHAVLKFCASEKWYKDHRIPYHFGIMLHGNPGTGKSTIVQVITSLIDCDVYYLNTDSVMSSIENDHWIRFSSKDRMRVIVIEDVDANSFSKTRKKNNDTESSSNSWTETFSIASFLNFVDGFGSPDKVIYIMTTNHLDDLDPALIRPGRIDLMCEIDYVSDETFSDFTKFHYGKIPDKSLHVRDKITCAELQTKVMEGCTFEEMCSYVGGNHNG